MTSRRCFLQSGLGLAALGLVPAWAQGGLGTPALPTPGFRRMKLGDVEILAVNDGIARAPLDEAFVQNAPLADVRALLASQGLATDHIDIPFTPFVVVAGGRRTLLDAGLGEFGGPNAGKLVDNLRAAGLAPGDIDAVLITHYHGDHISGLRDRAGALVFPNAKVMVPAPEHAFWMDDGVMGRAPAWAKGAFENVRRVFGPMPADKLLRFEPGGELLPGIEAVAAYGHTPGHTLYQVKSAGQRFYYVGDLTNVPALFARNPDWAVSFDMDAEAARVVRRKMLDAIVGSQAMVGGFHFPFPAFGRIERAGKGFAFQPA